MKYIYYLFSLAFITILFLSNATTPPHSIGFTARNELGPFHCLTCHSTFGLISPPQAPTGGLTLLSSGGSTYANSQIYNLSLTIDTANIRHGFQMVALDSNKNEIGNFVATMPHTQVERIYMFTQGDSMQHISHKDLPATNANTFTFNWQSPDTYTGPVTFYAFGVASNGNNTGDPQTATNPNGDRAYYGIWTYQYSPVSKIESLQNNNAIRIFPNTIPAYSQQTVQIELQQENTGTLQVDIIDINGRLMLSQTSFPFSGLVAIETPALPRGVYWVRIKKDMQFLSKPVLVY